MEKRIFGLETEYSISLRGRDGTFLHAPDARSVFFLPLQRALFSSLKNRDSFLRRVVLMRGDEECTYWIGASGGKLYRDASGIEYATPECETLEGIMRAEQCGDRLVWALSPSFRQEGIQHNRELYKDILITKSNSDAIGGAFVDYAHFSGSHENYQMGMRLCKYNFLQMREKAFFVRALASCLVMRMLFTGGGGIVREKDRGWKYVISPRALVTDLVYGERLTTAGLRPMISYRAAPHACRDLLDCPPDKLRLHIAVNDSTMRPDTLRFRFGFVSMLLRLFEEGLRKETLPLLNDPIEALHRFSRDITCTAKAPLVTGETRTLLGLCKDWLEIFSLFDAKSPAAFSPEEKRLLKDAKALLRKRVSDPDTFLRHTEWGLKFSLLSAYCRKKNIDFAHRRARGLDGYYSNIGPYGFYHAWERSCAEEEQGSVKPFSDEEWEALFSDKGLAPRAILRKRHLGVLAGAGCLVACNDWGSFELSNGDKISISDPLKSRHPRVEADIKMLRGGKILRRGT